VGYTHYWSFVPAAKGQTKQLEATYQAAILECQKVVGKLAEWNRETHGSSLMSGFTAHCTPGQYGGLKIGATQGEGGETFVMREHFNENETQDFCKTNRSSYDTAVVACLAILKYRLGDNIQVNSDGSSVEWEDGLLLARNILKRQIPNPIQPRQPKAQTYTGLRLAR
jgi:hypothetical protein